MKKYILNIILLITFATMVFAVDEEKGETPIYNETEYNMYLESIKNNNDNFENNSYVQYEDTGNFVSRITLFELLLIVSLTLNLFLIIYLVYKKL